MLSIDTQMSFFDEEFKDIIPVEADPKILVKESYTAEELRDLEIKGHHWYRKYILYYDELPNGQKIPKFWQASASLALLRNYMVFYRNGGWGFLKILNNNKQAMDFYKSKLKEYDEYNFKPHSSDVERVCNFECEYIDVRKTELCDSYACEDFIKSKEETYKIMEEAFMRVIIPTQEKEENTYLSQIKAITWKNECKRSKADKVMTVQIYFSHDDCEEDETEFCIEADDQEELAELFEEFCKENKFEDVQIAEIRIVRTASSFEELERIELNLS